MFDELKYDILDKIRQRQRQLALDSMPQWNGYAYVRKRNPIDIAKHLQACKPIPPEKQTDAHKLLKRFYQINQFTIPQNTKLFRVPHLQGNSFFAFPYYQSFYITVERGNTNVIHHAHLWYQATTGKKHWIASAKIEWDWNLIPKGRMELREKVMRLVNVKKFNVNAMSEERIIEK
jgi:hypothetical protein